MATSDASEHDWIFDYLGEALSSATFTAPLDAFVEGWFISCDVNSSDLVEILHEMACNSIPWP
jgi:hypothetical protein